MGVGVRYDSRDVAAQGRSKQHGDGGLADAALGVCYSDCKAHSVLSKKVKAVTSVSLRVAEV